MPTRTLQYRVNIGRDNAGRLSDEALANAVRTRLLGRFTLISGPECDRARVVLPGLGALLPERYDVRTRFVVERAANFTREDTEACDVAVFDGMRATCGAQWSINAMRGVLPVDGSGEGTVSYVGDIGTVKREVIAGNATSALPPTTDRLLSTTVVGSTNPSRVGQTNAGEVSQTGEDARRALEAQAEFTRNLAIAVGVGLGLGVVGFVAWKVFS